MLEIKDNRSPVAPCGEGDAERHGQRHGRNRALSLRPVSDRAALRALSLRPASDRAALLLRSLTAPSWFRKSARFSAPVSQEEGDDETKDSHTVA
jgi:hypothetical protein